MLEALAIRPLQNFARTSGKNASDIALVIDAMDMFHSEFFDAFAIVSSDGDFAGLASRLRRGGRYVFGFGKVNTPISLRNACDDFQQTELLVPETETETPTETDASALAPQMTAKHLRALPIEATVTYGDAEGWTDLSPAGDLIKRQRPDFQYTAFGATTFKGLLDQMKGEFETRMVERGAGTAAQYRAAASAARTKKRAG